MVKLSSFIFLVIFLISMIFLPEPFKGSVKKVRNKDIHTTFIDNPVSFKDQTLSWGLSAGHFQSGHKLTGLDEVMGGGACVFDMNNDGWQDIFVVGGSGQHRYYGKTAWWAKAQNNSLWLNTGKSRFTNATVNSQLPDIEWSMGCATGDLNNDSYIDLLVLTKGINRLFKNNGNGTFTEVTTKAGMENANAWSLNATMADYNGDDLLDIYVSNFIHYEKEAKVNERRSGFFDPVNAVFDPVLYNSQPNRLYENKGDFTFQEKAAEMGVENETGRSRAASWLDVNDDQKADLLVLNSGGSPNRLFINQWPEAFTTDASHYRVETAVGSSNLAIGDVENDGDEDIFIFASSGTPPKLLLNNFTQSRLKDSDNVPFLKDVAWQSSLANDNILYQSAQGLSLTDLNNDSWLDLYAANGLLSIDEDSGHLTVGQKDQIWLNKNGNFEAQKQSDYLNISARSVVYGDFNNDGKQDLLITHNNSEVRLLINTTVSEYSWLSLRLNDPNGSESNAVVTLKANGRNYRQKAFNRTSFLSQSGHRLHFGLAAGDKIENLMIKWMDGTQQTVEPVEINSVIAVQKDSNDIQYYSKNSVRPVTPLPEYYARLSAHQKVLFAQAVHAAKKDDRAAQLLFQVFKDEESLVRLRVLNMLADIKDQVAYLSILKKAVSDKAVAVRLLALDYVRKLELEQSVDWLIKILSDEFETEAVKCKAAETLTFFYHEEEAVIFRKYLAVPYLIRNLQDKSPRVKKCAATALAESERYRAVEPLIDLLQSEDESVKNKAVEALGLLRDTKAIKPLLTLIQAPLTSPATTAHILIALKRLNYVLVEELILGFSDISHTPQENLKNLESMEILLNLKGGIVFQKHLILSVRNSLFKLVCDNQQYDSRCGALLPSGSSHESSALSDDDKFSLWVSSLGIKTNKVLTDIIKNKNESISRRYNAMSYLADQKVKYVKTLLQAYIKDKGNAERWRFIPLLSNYDNSDEVRLFLWKLFRDPGQAFEIRFQSAKVLASKEPVEVVSYLVDL